MIDKLINDTLTEIEVELKKKRNIALSYKTSFVILVAFGCGQALFGILPKLLSRHFSIWINIVFISLFFLAIIVPILFIPLNKFLSDKTLEGINYRLKRQFVENEISKFNCSLEYRPKGGFDQDLFFRKKILNSTLKGASSDDLITGLFNNYPVKIAEYHVGGFFKSNFDGFVGIIYDNQQPSFKFYSPEFKSTWEYNTPTQIESLLLKFPNIMFAINTQSQYAIQGKPNNTLIFGIAGGKNMLEYDFSKVEKNAERYKADITTLNETLSFMDEFTKTKTAFPTMLQRTFQ